MIESSAELMGLGRASRVETLVGPDVDSLTANSAPGSPDLLFRFFQSCEKPCKRRTCAFKSSEAVKGSVLSSNDVPIKYPHRTGSNFCVQSLAQEGN
jgi:hypothetical protein